jgi:predicted nuclease with RNAse H fold
MREEFLLGIDYGAKLAGTTAIAFFSDGNLNVLQSAKGQDADLWLFDILNPLSPTQVCLDAPLSLPMVYRSKHASHQDYFYREADKEAKAMSPMFLGGLTARAMRLKAMLAQHTFFEAYPKLLASELKLQDFGYKTKIECLAPCWEELVKHFEMKEITFAPSNWHQFDAVLALFTAQRIFIGRAKQIGNEEEGLIWF